MTVDALPRTGPLHHWNGQFAELPDGVQVLLETFVAQVSLRIDREASGTVAAYLGVALPGPNTWVQSEMATVIWLGPDEWLVANPFSTPRDLESGLRTMVAGRGAVVDVSAQRTALQLRGEHARDVLASGCAIDLHPSAFPPGTAVQTTLGRTGVILLSLDDGDCQILVRSSFARYLATWLLDAAQEYRAPEHTP